MPEIKTELGRAIVDSLVTNDEQLAQLIAFLTENADTPMVAVGLLFQALLIVMSQCINGNGELEIEDCRSIFCHEIKRYHEVGPKGLVGPKERMQ